jgi:hypothetical protein
MIDPLLRDRVEFASKYLRCPLPDAAAIDEALPCTGGYVPSRKTIFIKDNSLTETIFHEMVHHKQHMENWIKTDGIYYYWKKKKPCGKGILIESLSDYATYWNAPHEVQARAIAKNMMSIWRIQ